MIWAGIRTVLGVSASVLVILFCASFAVTTIVEGDDSGTPAPSGGAEWEDYPATAWNDADAVLDDAGEEAVIARSDDLMDDIRAAVSAEFDIEWATDGANAPSTVDNGYGGQSMLRTWRGERWLGVIEARDAGARQRIQEILQRVGAEHGADEFVLSNDRDATGTQLAQEFGASDRADQAYWQSTLSGGPHRTHAVFAEVYDGSYPTADGYLGWTPRDSDGGAADPSTPTIWVSIVPSAYDLLPQGDRDEYEERLADYAGLEQPDGEF